MVDNEGKLVCCILCDHFWRRKTTNYPPKDGEFRTDSPTDRDICKNCMNDDNSCSYKHFERRKPNGKESKA